MKLRQTKEAGLKKPNWTQRKFQANHARVMQLVEN